MTNVINFSRRPPSGSTNLHITLLRHCIETAQLAGYGHNISLGLLHRILESAPHSFRQIADDEWAENSLLWNCIIKIEKRANAGEIPEADIERILEFWTKGFTAQQPNLRNTLLTQLKLLHEAMALPTRFPAQESDHSTLFTSWRDQ